MAVSITLILYSSILLQYCTGLVFEERKLELQAKEYKILCYFSSWAVYRPGKGSFGPDNIDPDLCTHYIYAFAILNSSTADSIVFADRYADIDMGFYQKMTALQSSGKKVMLSIGGDVDSATGKYSRLAGSESRRKEFAKQATDFILEHNFNGLDFDWEFPVCWRSNCTRGPLSDKENFVKLIVAIKKEFQKRKNGHELLLSIAVANDIEVIDKAYDLPALSHICDLISMMGYDFHGIWESKTGLVAPFIQQHGDDDETINVKSIIEYYIEKGVDPSKLVLGIPTYGAAFTLKNVSQHDIHAEILNAGSPGYYTNEGGTLAFYEIVKYIKRPSSDWSVVHVTNVGTYAYSSSYKLWIGYDDVGDVIVKAEYIKERALGGAMIWTLDMDNFMDNICKVKYPIISTVRNILKDIPVVIDNCT